MDAMGKVNVPPRRPPMERAGNVPMRGTLRWLAGWLEPAQTGGNALSGAPRRRTAARIRMYNLDAREIAMRQ